MTTDNATANALLAAASVQQRQRLLDDALGKGWRTINAFDLLFVFCLIGVFVAAARDDFRLGIAAAGFAIICLQIGVNIQLQRRVQALVRLLEKS